MGDPFTTAERLISEGEIQRAVLGLAWALRQERRLRPAEHGKLLLDGLTAGRRGGAAARAWMDGLRPQQTTLF